MDKSQKLLNLVEVDAKDKALYREHIKRLEKAINAYKKQYEDPNASPAAKELSKEQWDHAIAGLQRYKDNNKDLQ